MGIGQASGAIVSSMAAAFASKSYQHITNLFHVINIILQSNPINQTHQGRIHDKTCVTTYMVDKIRHFNAIEYHDDFADWLLQSKLEESGFIMMTPPPPIISATNIERDSMVSSLKSFEEASL